MCIVDWANYMKIIDAPKLLRASQRINRRMHNNNINVTYYRYMFFYRVRSFVSLHVRLSALAYKAIVRECNARQPFDVILKVVTSDLRKRNYWTQLAPQAQLLLVAFWLR